MATLFFIVTAFAGGYVARIVRPVRFLIGLNPVVKNLEATMNALHERLAEMEKAAASSSSSSPPSS